jgi:Ca2+-transporting ATPase
MPDAAANTPFTGLSTSEVLSRREQHGSNVLTPPRRVPWWHLYLEKFSDPVIRILIIAALIAIVAGAYHHDYIEGIGILLAIVLSTFLGFWNEYRAGREFELLNKVDDDVPFKVIRDSAVTTVAKRDIVVGDVLLMELGEEVPADGTLLEAVNLQVDESRLTGESAPVVKRVATGPGTNEHTYAENHLLRGTFIADGRGILEVTAVGDNTDIGKTARAASEETAEETPLNLQLARLSKLIGVLGLGFAIVTFFGLLLEAWLAQRLILPSEQWYFVWLLIASVFLALIRVWLPMVYDGLELLGWRASPPGWLGVESIKHWIAAVLAGGLLFALGMFLFVSMGWMTYQPSSWLPGNAGDKLLRYFMVSVTIIVVAVPEGLAMSVTLALAYSMRRMTASNNLVRRMHACETIGAATVICTDKTGTLTMNQMRTQGVHVPALGESLSLKQPVGQLLVEGLSVNSTAHLSEADGEKVGVGNPTEAATLLWLHDQGMNYAEARVRFRTVRQWTFSTERKFMGTLGQAAGMGGHILHVKGAPEIILARCETQLASAGKAPLTEADRQQIDARLREYQLRGMRTLGLAYHDRPIVTKVDDQPLETLATQLTWLGFFAIHDPVRHEVPGAIADCARAGVQVKMVTGDNPATAREIARQIGLWTDADDGAVHRLLTGPDFAAMPDALAREAVRQVKVMARARPLDKLRLVQLLKQNGEVVAVTGDGTNDAPAMNYADVGLAMGKTGTAVAKEASDIVLLDDSFKSIVNAIFWGRSLYQNIQRFLVFQLTINLSALTLALVAAFLTGGSTPLTVMQLLWVNLIMDTFAALALATEPPDPGVMKKRPRRPSDFIITRKMAWTIIGMGMLFVVALLGLLFYFQSQGPFDYDGAQHVLRSDTATEAEKDAARMTQQRLSLFFTFYVMLQFWNLFNARRFGTSRSVFHKPFENGYFWAIAGIILVGQFLITQFGGAVFSTYPLTIAQWCWILLSSAIVLIAGEGMRLVRRRVR